MPVLKTAQVEDLVEPASTTFFEENAYGFRQKRLRREQEKFLEENKDSTLSKRFLDKIGFGWLGSSGKATPTPGETPEKAKQEYGK